MLKPNFEKADGLGISTNKYYEKYEAASQGLTQL